MIPPEGANPHPHAVLAHVRHKPAVGARKGRRSERRHLGLSRQQIGARSKLGAPYGTRTRVSAVKGRCPRPLDEGRGGGATYRELCEREQATRRAARLTREVSGATTTDRYSASTPMAPWAG